MPDPHDAARAMYQKYLERAIIRARDREYADSVVNATSGSGRTPVEPLATMGGDGGPLRCDVCALPMILEGGGYQDVHADDAWRADPTPGRLSYISGGMTVLVETNGTLRVYHGYSDRSGCALAAERQDKIARDAWRSRPEAADVEGKLEALSAFFRAERPDLDSDRTLSDIHRVLFAYDPGPGINGP